MSWSNDVVTRVVTGTYLTGRGVPARGRITFTPTATVVDLNDAVLIPGAVVATLDARGRFSVTLPTTDNPNLSPDGWAYEINVRLYGVKPQKFFIFLPYGDGSDVDLSTELSSATAVADSTALPPMPRGPIGPVGPTGPALSLIHI